MIEFTELAPLTDLRRVLNAARARIAGGWMAEEIGPSCAFFFATRERERILVTIERREPNGPLGLDKPSDTQLHNCMGQVFEGVRIHSNVMGADANIRHALRTARR